MFLFPLVGNIDSFIGALSIQRLDVFQNLWLPPRDRMPIGRMEKSQLGKEVLTPEVSTWNLKINPWKRRFLLETIIFRFHVKLWGCTDPELIYYIYGNSWVGRFSDNFFPWKLTWLAGKSEKTHLQMLVLHCHVRFRGVYQLIEHTWKQLDISRCLLSKSLLTFCSLYIYVLFCKKTTNE